MIGLAAKCNGDVRLGVVSQRHSDVSRGMVANSDDLQWHSAVKSCYGMEKSGNAKEKRRTEWMRFAKVTNGIEGRSKGKAERRHDLNCNGIGLCRKARAKNAGETSCKGIANHRQAEELH